MPLISIIMATYNQEAFVGSSIQSVLDQSFQDFELIVINDGSKDHTGEVACSFNDPRIVYIEQKNQGPNAAYNHGLIEARGEFICFLPGDDLYYPDKLEKQVQFMHQTKEDIAFSWVEFIDEQDETIKGDHFAAQYFNHPQRTQAETYRWFFLKGNYFSLTTIIARRKLFEEVGLFQTTAIQLSDFDYYIQLIKRGPLPIIQEKLVKYRIRSSEQNVSSLGNSVRIYFENHQIFRYFFDDVSEKLFRDAFSELLLDKNFRGEEQFELEKAFLYLKNEVLWVQSIGAEKLFTLLQDSQMLKLAQSKYDFGLPEYYSLTNRLDVTNSKNYSEALNKLEELQSQVNHLQTVNYKQLQELEQVKYNFEQVSKHLQSLQNTLTVKFGRFIGKVINRLVEVFVGQGIRGHIDQVELNGNGQLKVQGWVSCRIGGVQQMELYLGEKYLGDLKYGLERSDIVAFPLRRNRWCGYSGEMQLDIKGISKNSSLKMRIIDNKGKTFEQLITNLHLIQ